MGLNPPDTMVSKKNKIDAMLFVTVLPTNRLKYVECGIKHLYVKH